jgi:hypothetical protein
MQSTYTRGHRVVNRLAADLTAEPPVMYSHSAPEKQTTAVEMARNMGTDGTRCLSAKDSRWRERETERERERDRERETRERERETERKKERREREERDESGERVVKQARGV